MLTWAETVRRLDREGGQEDCRKNISLSPRSNPPIHNFLLYFIWMVDVNPLLFVLLCDSIGIINEYIHKKVNTTSILHPFSENLAQNEQTNASKFDQFQTQWETPHNVLKQRFCGQGASFLFISTDLKLLLILFIP